MKKVAEIIHIVESRRAEFIRGAVNPDEETEKVLYLCGVRKQQYFALNDLIFMTFEYKGENFKEDMAKMAAYLDSKGLLVQKRRKDVPIDERENTNWWAPVKKLGSILEVRPEFDDEVETKADYMAMLDGSMGDGDDYADISYDEDEWLELIHF